MYNADLATLKGLLDLKAYLESEAGEEISLEYVIECWNECSREERCVLQEGGE
jgi:hypothetical protein